MHIVRVEVCSFKKVPQSSMAISMSTCSDKQPGRLQGQGGGEGGGTRLIVDPQYTNRRGLGIALPKTSQIQKSLQIMGQDYAAAFELKEHFTRGRRKYPKTT